MCDSELDYSTGFLSMSLHINLSLHRSTVWKTDTARFHNASTSFPREFGVA